MKQISLVKIGLNILLVPSAMNKIVRMANKSGVSQSEIIEQIILEHEDRFIDFVDNELDRLQSRLKLLKGQKFKAKKFYRNTKKVEGTSVQRESLWTDDDEVQIEILETAIKALNIGYQRLSNLKSKVDDEFDNDDFT